MHPWHSEYYIRTVRADNKDPLTELMKAYDVPNEPDVMKVDSTTVFSFPVKAPEGAILRNDLTAIEHLNTWLVYQRAWCEHKPSITVSVKEEEWMEVGAWVYKHFDEVSGISFLPYSDHTYKQAPYQQCSKEEYEELLAKMPKAINWSDLSFYEKEDMTTGSQSFACSADNCEIVDLTSSSS
jgi:ribonucleoside-diphosphate reductase alpha chain